MIAGCEKSEEDAPADNDPAEISTGTQDSSDDSPTDDPEDETDSDEDTTETEEPVKESQTTSGLSTSDIVGTWSGKFFLDPAIFEAERAKGTPEQQIQQQVRCSKRS